MTQETLIVEDESPEEISASPAGLFSDELAARWRCVRQTIYRQIRNGRLRTIRVGRKHLIPYSEIHRHESGQAAKEQHAA
jgi:excisionase family DNA binding protein